jgi:hypothetical protein
MACAAATKAALARLVQAQALAPESVRWIDSPPTHPHSISTRARFGRLEMYLQKRLRFSV